MTEWQISLFTGIAGITAFSVWRIAEALARIARALENEAPKLVKELDYNGKQLERIGTKLDAIWSPITGINNVLWRKSGLNTDYD